MNHPPAGGASQPPAGATTPGVATPDDLERLVHDAAQAYADVVRTARAWKRTLCDHRIAAATRTDHALVDAIQHLESIHAAVRRAQRPTTTTP